ncbi:MAG: glycoside hydrolase family 3 protein, partial [Lachnospiraceae bacterium]|nr:glycoside hydrolase family 3 protein [Lachnospiraceae bacterium]
SFNMKDAASYAPDKQAYLLEAGEYILKIGADSDKVTAVSVIEVPETVIIRQVKALFGDPGFEDKEYNSAAIGAAADIPTDLPRFTVAPADLPRFTVAAADLPQETVSYEIDEPLLPEIRALSDEQLAYLGLGLFNPKGGVISMIGSAGKNVAGAAGETTDRVPLLPTLVMADGPAGLRLTKQHYRDEKGIHALNQASIPDSIMVFMPGPLKFLLSLTGSGKKKAPKGAKVIEQYATAIPIGTAIAQSFNTDFAEICGDVVGAEMEHFGVHLWLAPALNIHRSIFCGRNFEYYSEDPFVSGKMAAAVTRGVQKHPGRTVTLKHFAANNQEKNRVNSNSHVSERAMREIYLKGFEICIRESRPGALMTSYNLLNGTHTMENAPLLQGFLRAECGYEGLIMTDWVVKGSSAVKNPKYAQVTSAGIANAGGGLMMPGSKDDYAVLLAALKDGTADRRQLQVNASRLLAAARELTK